MIMQQLKNNFRYLISVILIICAGILSIIWQKSILLGSNVGFIDLFIYGNTYGNIIMDIFAPLIAIITIQHPFKLLTDRNSTKHIGKNILLYTCKQGLKTGAAFAVGLFILLILCLTYNSDLPKVTLDTNGAFSEILKTSKPIFIILFILHSFTYGFFFAIFGIGLACTTKSKFIFYFTPVLVNQLALYTPYLFPLSVLKEVIFFTPELPYDVLTNPNTIIDNLWDIFIVGIIGVMLIFIQYKKYSKVKRVVSNEI